VSTVAVAAAAARDATGTASPRLCRYVEYGDLLKDQIVDGVSFLHQAIDKSSKILAEGANAALLDIDFGTYDTLTPLTHNHEKSCVA
jgi:adenylosuccinate synthase